MGKLATIIFNLQFEAWRIILRGFFSLRLNQPNLFLIFKSLFYNSPIPTQARGNNDLKGSSNIKLWNSKWDGIIPATGYCARHGTYMGMCVPMIVDDRDHQWSGLWGRAFLCSSQLASTSSAPSHQVIAVCKVMFLILTIVGGNRNVNNKKGQNMLHNCNRFEAKSGNFKRHLNKIWSWVRRHNVAAKEAGLKTFI